MTTQPTAASASSGSEPILTASAVTTRYLLQKVIAEFIGTFALVFVGCGAIAVDAGGGGISGGGIGATGVALAFGLTIMVMIYATGHISGAHFNPAVTVAFAVVGRFPWRQVPAYVGGQTIAAIAAAAALRAVLDPAQLGVTAPAGSLAQSFTLEVVLTFLLMFVITSVATDSRAVGEMAGWAIGGTVALAALFGGPISGASMNPARSLGPAVISGAVDHLWLYVVAPALGAAAGAAVYQAIRCGGDKQQATGCC